MIGMPTAAMMSSMIVTLLTLLLAVAASDAFTLQQQSNHHRLRNILDRRTSLKELLLNQASGRYSDQVFDASGNGGPVSHSFIAQNVTWTTTPFNPTVSPDYA